MKNIVKLLLTSTVFLCIFFLLFWKLGATHLTNWDEAWYAGVARGVATTKNVLIPLWNTKPFFEKPPLYYWITALWFRVLGVSEFSARLTSAIAGLGIAILLYTFGSEFMNFESALISLIVLFSSPEFLYRTRTGNLDSLLVFCITLAAVSFYKGVTKNSRWFYVMGIAFAGSFLTKGIVSLYIIGFSFLIILAQSESRAKIKDYILGVGIGFLIVGFWLLLSYSSNGSSFLTAFERSNTEKFGFQTILHNFSLLYLTHLKNGLKLWTIVYVLSCVYLIFRIKKQLVLFIFLFPLLFLFILSFSANKSNWFILPIYPFVALTIGYFFYEIRVFVRKQYMFLIIVAVLCIALFQNIKYRNDYFTPDVAFDEAKVAIYASKVTKVNEPIYLTNYYYPTTVYYSQRKVYAVYSNFLKNQSWWILSKSAWKSLLAKKNIIIITTNSELKNLQRMYPDAQLKIIYQSGDKLLVKTV